MKNITYTFTCLLALLLIACQPPDDGPIGDSFSFEIQNLINPGTENTYAIGDILWIEISHNDELSNENETIKLSELTFQNQDALSYTYLSLFKQGDFTNPTNILLNENEITIDKGRVELTNGGFTMVQEFDQTTQTYTSRMGIELKEAGEFFLSSNSNYSATQNEIYIDGLANAYVSILTNIQGAGTDNNFFFTVE